MKEAHILHYVMHHRGSKLYQTIKEIFWWNIIKRDLAKFILKFLVSQNAKERTSSPGRFTIALIDGRIEMGENNCGHCF